ncbi:hypothetical protein Vqi01_47250 [Micromonospora qiuiae]|uniref:HNH endonuclease n=1 Tax=Micromonospora qiuiae TaxID=502268 RepID=A0ABQ4JGB9_9ACTN|nr:hypothetical protein Vqi01_47250 [Micromonospora qiuiae]
MAAPFLSLAQIRNRQTLAARRTLRDQARQEGRCPVCGQSTTAASGRSTPFRRNGGIWLGG